MSGRKTPANRFNYAFVTLGMHNSTGSPIFFGLPIFPGSLILDRWSVGTKTLSTSLMRNGFAFSIQHPFPIAAYRLESVA